LKERKLQQIILFFLERINNHHLGRTKLMKLLYFVDFDHYEKHERSITGAEYRKFPHGPYPQDADKIIETMKRLEQVREVKVAHNQYAQNRLITLNARFDPSLFSGEELQTLERVAVRWADATASQIEAATHNEAPWAATGNGKIIDYEMAAYRQPIGSEPLDQMLSASRKFAKYVASFA
jgi:uncharacterized phage-associated protein